MCEPSRFADTHEAHNAYKHTHIREHTTQTYGSINSKAFFLSSFCSLCLSARIYPRNTLETHWEPNEANQIERSWMERKKYTSENEIWTKKIPWNRFNRQTYDDARRCLRHCMQFQNEMRMMCVFTVQRLTECPNASYSRMGIQLFLRENFEWWQKKKRRQNAQTERFCRRQQFIVWLSFAVSLFLFIFPFPISEQQQTPTNQPIYGVNFLELNFLVFLYALFFSTSNWANHKLRLRVEYEFLKRTSSHVNVDSDSFYFNYSFFIAFVDGISWWTIKKQKNDFFVCFLHTKNNWIRCFHTHRAHNYTTKWTRKAMKRKEKTEKLCRVTLLSNIFPSDNESIQFTTERKSCRALVCMLRTSGFCAFCVRRWRARSDDRRRDLIVVLCLCSPNRGRLCVCSHVRTLLMPKTRCQKRP